jgi:hypothetical protein
MSLVPVAQAPEDKICDWQKQIKKYQAIEKHVPPGIVRR